jgi:hypothetical protein
MVKNDKTKTVAAKPVVADTKKSSKNRVNRQKEKSFIKKTGFNPTLRTTVQVSKAHKCIGCLSSFTCLSAFTIHKKSCGVCKDASVEDVDYDSTLTRAQLADIRGERYARLKHFDEWKPSIKVQRYMTVIVDEKTVVVNAETGETKQQYITERQFVTRQKYRSYADLLNNEPYFDADENDDDDGANLMHRKKDKGGYDDNYDDNYEGADMEIIDE